MIPRFNVARIRKYAIREMMSREGCKHAIYGLHYNNITCKFAENPNQIKYFYTDDAFEEYLQSVNNTGSNVEAYAVHRVDVELRELQNI